MSIIFLFLYPFLIWYLTWVLFLTENSVFFNSSQTNFEANKLVLWSFYEIFCLTGFDFSCSTAGWTGSAGSITFYYPLIMRLTKIAFKNIFMVWMAVLSHYWLDTTHWSPSHHSPNTPLSILLQPAIQTPSSSHRNPVPPLSLDSTSPTPSTHFNCTRELSFFFSSFHTSI